MLKAQVSLWTGGWGRRHLSEWVVTAGVAAEEFTTSSPSWRKLRADGAVGRGVGGSDRETAPSEGAVMGQLHHASRDRLILPDKAQATLLPSQ